MKNPFIFVAGIVAIVLVVGIGFWTSHRSTPAPILTSQPVTSETPTSSSSSTLVTPISADVFSKPSDDVAYTPLKDSSQVAGGGSVKTSATGRALLEGKNTTILDANTEIKLAVFDPEKNQTRLQLEAGQVWSRVQKLSDKGEFYEIETQNARASVRGTSFGLKKKGTTLTLYVTEGTVGFGGISTHSTVDVTAGHKAVLHEGDPVPVVSDLTDADKRDAWYLYNNPTSQEKTQTSSSQEKISAPADTRPESETSTKTETSPSTTSNEPATAPTSSPAPTSSTPQQNKTITPMTDSSVELLLSSASPSTVSASAGGTVTLSGVGFVKAQVVSVFVGKTRITNFRVVSDTKLEMTIGVRQLSAGTYDVDVEGSQDEFASLSPGLSVNP